MEADTESIRLRIHLVAETGDGKRLAEITRAPVFPLFRTHESWMRGDQAFRTMLEHEVIAPARALVAAHLRKLDDVPFIRIEQPMPEANIKLPEAQRENLDGLFAEITRQRG
jgi:hypothetical protein